MKMRIFALVVALCLVINIMPVGVLSEEDVLPEATAVVTAEPTESPTEAPTEAPTETPTELPAEAATEVPAEAPTEVPTEAPAEEEEAYNIEETVSPEFERGYAIVLTDDTVVENEDDGDMRINRGTVVYAEKRDADGRLLVWFDTRFGEAGGLVDAECLRPLTDEQITAFCEEAEAREDVRWFDDAKKLPLDFVDDVLYENTAITMTAGETEILLNVGESAAAE